MRSDALTFSSAGEESFNFLVELRSDGKTLEREVPNLFDVSAVAEIGSAFIIAHTWRKGWWARFSHALFKWMLRGTETSILACTLGDVSGGAVAFFSKAEAPASGWGLAFFLAVLKSWDAFGIFLAGSPLVGAFLLDALLRVGVSHCSLEGISDSESKAHWCAQGWTKHNALHLLTVMYINLYNNSFSLPFKTGNK
jgi:hypothetical protein